MPVVNVSYVSYASSGPRTLHALPHPISLQLDAMGIIIIPVLHTSQVKLSKT